MRIHSWYNYTKSLVSVKDLIITQTLDTSGRPDQIKYRVYGNTTIPTKTITYTYGPLSNGTENPYLIPTTIIIGNITTTNIINKNGQITKQSQSSSQSGSTTKSIDYTYYSDATQPNYGLVNTVDGPKVGTGDKVTYTYDDFGNLTNQSQKINGVIRTISYVGYNNFAQPERIINPNGLVQLFSYNADGTVNTEINGPGGSTGAISGQTKKYTYNNLKQVVSETSPDGEVTSYSYDLIGRLSVIRLPNKSTIVYHYSANGIIESEIYSTSNNNEVLVKNNIVGINGRIDRTYSGYDRNKLYTNYYYDRNGNIENSTTVGGISEYWAYDALNRLKTHTDGMGKVDTKDYDINDNIISAKDALNAGSYPLSYRNGNVLTQEINSDFGIKTYAYNEADQPTQRMHVDRKCNYNSIDEIGRYGAFVCASNSGTTPSEYQVNDNYTYDQSRFGRLDKVSSSVEYDVNTYYSYDVYDRITQKRQENLLWYVSAENKNLTVNYSYSLGGKQTRTTLPSGRVIDYNYNLSEGTLTGISLNNSPLIRNITYDGANRVTSWLWGGSNASYNISYIANISLINTIFNKDNNGTINYSLTYGYDNDSRITSINRNNGLNDIYKYDNANRLTLESRFNGNTAVYTVGYGYDANGNRNSLSTTGTHLQPAASASYAYSGNKLTSFNKDGIAQALNYTANAELAFGPYSAAYDNGGRRKADHAANFYYFMNYNHKNERITRGMSSNIPASAVQYIYDENSHLIGEYSGSTPIVEYVWMGDTPIAAIYGSGATTKIYYIITDHLNTPRRLVDSSNQAIAWSWDSTAFGLGNPTGSITFNLRFPGQYYDVGTNQFYNHNRFYNPELGRYMEPDPIGREGGLNPYAYAGSNPVMNSDASGLQSTGQWLDDQAMRAADVVNNNPSFWNQVNLFKWSFTNVTWNVLGSENISLLYDGQKTSKLGVGFEAAAVIPFVGPVARVSNTEKAFALGIGEHLDDFAKNLNASTWKNLPDVTKWKNGVMDALSNPNVPVHFNLTDVNVWQGVQRAASGRGGATDWELLKIKENPQFWDKITFWNDGKK